MNLSLSVKDLCFSIGQRKILHNINLDFFSGEFVGLIGPNGSGKSTFLKCLNGINTFEGQVLVNGQSLSTFESKALAREISLMNQETSITFPFSCRDVVLMGRYPYSKTALTTPEKDAAAADQYMKKIGINHLRDQKSMQFPAVNDSGFFWQSFWHRKPASFCWMSLFPAWTLNIRKKLLVCYGS